MFGLALSCRLIQGTAVRSWNSITHFANLLWCKLNHSRNNIIMPRSRRRYHSRSRSRSRSHSYDREREFKRRKLDNGDHSPYSKTISPEDHPEDVALEEEEASNERSTLDYDELFSRQCKVILVDCADLVEQYTRTIENENSEMIDSDDVIEVKDSETNKSNILHKKRVKSLTPSQRKKQIERQKVHEAKLAEREMKKQQILEEKQKIKNEKEKDREEKLRHKQDKEEQKLKEKQEKKELKQKEIEEKQREKELKDEKKKKELEEKEQKRKEKEEKDELRRKEKEEKEELKRKEFEDRKQEKLKQEEKKQKVVARFVNFFTKINDPQPEEKKCEETANISFMPFKVKADMRIAPQVRKTLTESERSYLTENLQNGNTKLYLDELKDKIVGKSGKTWPFEGLENDDVIIVEDTNIGESIEDIPETQKIRGKFFKFDENRRPPYFGSWRKRSKIVKPRKPFGLDKEVFDYEMDSDDEWEEEEEIGGESLKGSDDDDKENEDDNDYEVDNEFFVPHGHLSDDEVNDEDTNIESPEAHKAKLRLLKKEFEAEMKDQTHKIKPRVIGCVWEKKLHSTIDDAIYEFLKPFSIITNGPVIIKKRSEFTLPPTPVRKSGTPAKPLSAELIPKFLKFIHGSTSNMPLLINEFLSNLTNSGISTDVSKRSLKNESKKFAEWKRNPDEGPLYNKFCWYVNRDFQEKYSLDFSNLG